MAQAEREKLSVAMFPWLAHGHITPFLELAKRLTSDDQVGVDVIVHLVSTPVNLAAIAHRQTARIRLVELHLPALPDLPPALHTTKHLPARLMPVLKRACDLSAPRFGALLDELRPDVLLYDFLQPWAPLEAAARGVPAAHFSTCSAAATAFFVHCLSADRAPRAFPFEAISLGSAEEEAKYTALFAIREDNNSLVSERDRLLLSLARSSGFVAVKTCADIERKYVDYLSELVGGKDIIPCGPLLVDYGDGEPQHGTGESGEPNRVMRWLDGQEPGTVLLASFGSEYFMSEQQIAQMARGLELSGERFVWVVRFPKSPDEDRDAARALPRGFAPARGLVVEGWAPQRRILSHPSCGAFLTHCGWSSVLESLSAGVPMVALPLHIDQPLNANLAAELGAAARVPQERFGEFRAEDVARAVRGAMRGEESQKVRRRARELREVVARNDANDTQIGALVERMARLCGKGQGSQVAVPN
ncbi:UDP-glucosyltransferase 29-like [Phragmites australis]|uniref:UDP-glucosyltransferase 29-like n=1 Tax=Phragmites australis TaxID=29695 RepID=UPI002D793794|nr:UDP-glucosyltransferase 29-like [Phragmites australis]